MAFARRHVTFGLYM